LDELADRVILVRGGEGASTTNLLASVCDGMMLENSKCYTACGFFGTPLQRTSRFRTGGWLNAYENRDRFFRDIRGGGAKGAADDDALTWFAFRVANDLISSSASVADIVARFERRVDPSRWDTALERYNR
jgi:hypothetical protein